MTHDIVGEWDLAEVSKATRGKGSPLGRIAFLEQDGRVVVKNADPGVTEKPSRVEIDGSTIRFEILSGRSARGNTNYAYEISLHGRDVFGGTRRQGLLSKTPITGQRVAEAASASPSYATGDLSTSLIAMPGSVAEAKARAAEAAERAALAAAEAAAMLAEAEAAAAAEAARRAAENAAAARAAVHTQASAEPPAAAPQPGTLPTPEMVVPPQAFGAPSAPVQPWPVIPGAPAEHLPVPTGSLPAVPAAFGAEPAFTPVPDAAGAPGRRQVRITHRLSREGRSTLAAEVFPGVFVWGDSLVTTESRLRQVGWEVTPIATDATIDVDDTLLEHAAVVRDSFAR